MGGTYKSSLYDSVYKFDSVIRKCLFPLWIQIKYAFLRTRAKTIHNTAFFNHFRAQNDVRPIKVLRYQASV